MLCQKWSPFFFLVARANTGFYVYISSDMQGIVGAKSYIPVLLIFTDFTTKVAVSQHL